MSKLHISKENIIMIIAIAAFVGANAGAYLLVSKYVSEEIRIMNEIESK